MGDAILAWLARWGRVIAAYAVITVVMASLIYNIMEAIGLDVPFHTPSYYITYVADALANTSTALHDLLQPNSGGFGDVLIYSFGLETWVLSMSWILASFSVGFYFASSMTVAIITVLSYRWAYDKLVIKSNAVAGIKLGK